MFCEITCTKSKKQRENDEAVTIDKRPSTQSMSLHYLDDRHWSWDLQEIFSKQEAQSEPDFFSAKKVQYTFILHGSISYSRESGGTRKAEIHCH